MSQVVPSSPTPEPSVLALVPEPDLAGPVGGDTSVESVVESGSCPSVGVTSWGSLNPAGWRPSCEGRCAQCSRSAKPRSSSRLLPVEALKVSVVHSRLIAWNLLYSAVWSLLGRLGSENGILMFTLPANATHIFQPLDVAVFKPFKTIIRDCLQLQMYEKADPALSKQTAIEIACYAYRSAIIDNSSNAIEKFRGNGLYHFL